MVNFSKYRIFQNPKPSSLLHLHQSNREITNFTSGPASSPNLSIWKRKKVLSKEGLIAAKEPDMLKTEYVFYRDMLMMLARNKRVEEIMRVWEDLKKEGVLFDHHTFGDLVRVFWDNELLVEAMRLYEEMRDSPDPPLSLPFRVILKGLVSYPELREKVKEDFLELFPGMVAYDPPEVLFNESDDEARTDSDLE